MTNTELIEYLKAHRNISILEWLGTRDSTQMWLECKRPDWLMWFAATVVPRKALVLVACDCAATALKYAAHDVDLPRRAISAARQWVYGGVDLDKVRDASNVAAYAAYTAFFAADTALAATNGIDATAYAAAKSRATVAHAASVIYLVASATDPAVAVYRAAQVASFSAFAPTADPTINIASIASNLEALASARAEMCALIRGHWPVCPIDIRYSGMIADSYVVTIL